MLVGGEAAAALGNINFVDVDSSTSDLSTYTFSTKDFLTPAANRFILVTGAAIRNTSGTLTELSSGTIGGVSLTVVGTRNVSDSVIFACSAPVPSGATGDISLTFDGSAQRIGIAHYVAYVDTVWGGDNGTLDSGEDTISLGYDLINGVIAVVGMINGGDTTDRVGTINDGFTINGDQFIESAGNVWHASKETTTGSSGSATAGWTTNTADNACVLYGQWVL